MKLSSSYILTMTPAFLSTFYGHLSFSFCKEKYERQTQEAVYMTVRTILEIIYSQPTKDRIRKDTQRFVTDSSLLLHFLSFGFIVYPHTFAGLSCNLVWHKVRGADEGM